MATKFLEIIFLLGLITVSTQKSVLKDDDQEPKVFKSADDLKKFLEEQLTQNPKENRYDGDNPNRYTRNRHHHHDHHDENPSNLLNIQTINLILKNTNLRNKKNLERLKKEISGDRSPSKSDRSPDSGDEEVMQLLDELEKELEKDSNEAKVPLRCDSRCVERLGSARCGCGGRGRGRWRVDRDDDDDDNDRDVNLRCDGDRCEVERGKRKDKVEQIGKTYKITDDVDAVVLEISDLDELLSGLTKQKKSNSVEVIADSNLDEVVKEIQSVNEKVKSASDKAETSLNRDILKEIDNILSSDKQAAENEEPGVSPEEFVKYYESLKLEVLNKILRYLADKTNKKLNVDFLTNNQKRSIEELKSKIAKRATRPDIGQLQQNIIDILFGGQSISKVKPHNENNHNIYIPKWAYENMVQSRNNHLRSKKKRMLPLTSKQISKLIKRNKSMVRPKSNIWRRSVNKNLQNYGVPFELNVQGLGQVNP